jgi:mRNA-degrading endonuclease RelE of RelBE toxin-antitoxin system
MRRIPPRRLTTSKRLIGVDALRLRIGDFRVISSETPETITVLDIGPPGDIYE